VRLIGDAGHPFGPSARPPLPTDLNTPRRLRISRAQLAMHLGDHDRRVQRDRIGVAAHDGRIALVILRAGLRHPRLARARPGSSAANVIQAPAFFAIAARQAGDAAERARVGVHWQRCGYLIGVVISVSYRRPREAGDPNHQRSLFSRAPATSRTEIPGVWVPGQGRGRR